VVAESSRVQGWKLHLSSVQVQAADLLQAVVPILQGRQLPFKIVRDEATLGQLNEGELGATQVGKFMTIYPPNDRVARDVAGVLLDLTDGFFGPRILTDLRLGEVVYARFGAFNPVISRDRLGQLNTFIQSSDGTLVRDEYQVPYAPPPDQPNPFIDLAVEEEPAPANPRLLGPGYLVVDVVKAHAKGNVFQCLDLRDSSNVCAKILKQGRPGCMSDSLGRDIRWRLQRQHQLHRELDDDAIPKVDPYFETRDVGYLPLQFIPGKSIEAHAASTLAARPWSDLDVDVRETLIGQLVQLVQIVRRIHRRGFVHRDIAASNVWIADSGEVYLLDLELAHSVDDPAEPLTLGTPGFMSPQQTARRRPRFEDDVFALGATCLLTFTGLDPRRVIPTRAGRRIRSLECIAALPTTLSSTVLRALRSSPSQRPGLDELEAALESAVRPTIERRPPLTERQPGRNSRRVVRSAVRSLTSDELCFGQVGLWRSQPLDGSSAPFELRRSANRGVAGALYVLARAVEAGFDDEGAVPAAKQASEWLLADTDAPDASLPGLHFGNAGVAVALVSAVVAGLIDRTAKIDRRVATYLSGPLDWLDVTHGAAGQGVASLICAEAAGEPSFADTATRCAHYLIERQEPDGSWVTPAGVEGMSGATLTGYAHGVAGIVDFLCEFGTRLQDRRALAAADRGGRWLIDVAEPGAAGLEWSYSDTNPERWKWWCHGSPGIALALLRLFSNGRGDRFGEAATQALLVHPEDVRNGNLTQCHGLSGLGEIYMDAATVLGPEWHRRADFLAKTLRALAIQRPRQQLVWLAEDPVVPTADLMVGSAGIAHFLIRHARPNATAAPLRLPMA
jgi:serine/threonine protein kinase